MTPCTLLEPREKVYPCPGIQASSVPAGCDILWLGACCYRLGVPRAQGANGWQGPFWDCTDSPGPRTLLTSEAAACRVSCFRPVM